LDVLAIRRDLGDDNDVATVLNSLGLLAHERKDYVAAEKYFREALEFSQQSADKEVQALPISGLGALALDCKQWAEARQWYEQELALAKEIGQVSLIASANYGLACVWEAESRPGMNVGAKFLLCFSISRITLTIEVVEIE